MKNIRDNSSQDSLADSKFSTEAEPSNSKSEIPLRSENAESEPSSGLKDSGRSLTSQMESPSTSMLFIKETSTSPSGKPTRTSQRYLLIDETAAKELLDVLGREFIHHDNERVHRLLGMCGRLANPNYVATRDDLFGHIVREHVSMDVRNSVRIVHLSYRDGSYIIREA